MSLYPDVCIGFTLYHMFFKTDEEFSGDFENHKIRAKGNF